MARGRRRGFDRRVPSDADRGSVTETDDLHEVSTPAELAQSRAALLVASSGFFLITLDILIVNVALTRIARELGGGTVGQQWVVDGYTLFFAALLLFAGSLADRTGAKRAFGTGVALFGLTSVACAVAPSIGTLVAARAGQGAAAAVMLPASMALVREAFPDPARRARALGRRGRGRRGAGPVAGRNPDRAQLAMGVRCERSGLRGDAGPAGPGRDVGHPILPVRLGRADPRGDRAGRRDVRADRGRCGGLRHGLGDRHPARRGGEPGGLRSRRGPGRAPDDAAGSVR